jgi:hypothetical protein
MGRNLTRSGESHARGKQSYAAQQVAELFGLEPLNLRHLGDGTFGKWCQERCGIFLTSTKQSVAAFEQFKDPSTVSQSLDATYLTSAFVEVVTTEELPLSQNGIYRFARTLIFEIPRFFERN